MSDRTLTNSDNESERRGEIFCIIFGFPAVIHINSPTNQIFMKKRELNLKYSFGTGICGYAYCPRCCVCKLA